MEKRNVKYRSLLALALIISLGILYRTYNIEAVPYWHWDEGVNMNIAWNLANGKLLWFTIKYAFVPHPPLFYLMAAAVLKAFGNELVVLRGLCVFYSVLSIILVYAIGKKLGGEYVGLLSALLLAIYPTAIYWNMMGFANNQVMLLSLLTFTSVTSYLRGNGRQLYIAGLFTGLGLVTEIMGAAAFLAACFLLWRYGKRDIVKFALLSTIPFLLYVCAMLYLMPEEFINDFTSNSGRTYPVALALIVLLAGAVHYINKTAGIAKKLEKIYAPIKKEIVENPLLFFLPISIIAFFFMFPSSDDGFLSNVDYYWIGLPGIYLIRDRLNRDAITAFLISNVLLLIWLNRTDHMMIQLYPFISILFAFLLYHIYRVSCTRVAGYQKIAAIVVIALVFHPIALTTYRDVELFFSGKYLRNENIGDRLAVAELVNERTNPDDYVLTDSHMTRLIRCKTSVVIQSAAYDGKGIDYMRSDYEPERFVFNCSFRNAKLVALSRGGVEYCLETPELHEMINVIETWDKEVIGSYVIYTNPLKN